MKPDLVTARCAWARLNNFVSRVRAAYDDDNLERAAGTLRGLELIREMFVNDVCTVEEFVLDGKYLPDPRRFKESFFDDALGGIADIEFPGGITMSVVVPGPHRAKGAPMLHLSSTDHADHRLIGRVTQLTAPDQEWSVVVGNVGTVYRGSCDVEASDKYRSYIGISQQGVGRGGNEPVTLLLGGEVMSEYQPPPQGDEFSDEELDEMVHEVFAGMAADVNNQGPEAQIAFLRERGVIR